MPAYKIESAGVDYDLLRRNNDDDGNDSPS